MFGENSSSYQHCFEWSLKTSIHERETHNVWPFITYHHGSFQSPFITYHHGSFLSPFITYHHGSFLSPFITYHHGSFLSPFIDISRKFHTLRKIFSDHYVSQYRLLMCLLYTSVFSCTWTCAENTGAKKWQTIE